MKIRYPFKGKSTTYKITQKFGENPHIYKRFGLRGHSGLDFSTPLGTPIVACDDGICRENRFDKNGYGWYVKLIHSWGESLYAHFQEKSFLRVNSKVKKGEVIGYADSTGFSTGHHLHFAIRVNPYNRNDGWLGYTDPLPYLKGGAMSPSGDTVSKESYDACMADREKFWKKSDELEKELERVRDEFKKQKEDYEREIRSLRTRNIEQQKQIEEIAEKLGTGKELGKILAAIQRGNDAVDVVERARRETERVKKELENYKNEVKAQVKAICEMYDIPLTDFKGLREALMQFQPVFKEENRQKKGVKLGMNEKLNKVLKVLVWVGIPYAVLKVVEVLSGVEGFAEYSPLLNVIAYIAKQFIKEEEK